MEEDDTLLGSSKGCALYLCVSRWREEEGSLTTVGSLNPGSPLFLSSSSSPSSSALPRSSPLFSLFLVPIFLVHAHVRAGNWPASETQGSAIYILHAKIRVTDSGDQSVSSFRTVPRALFSRRGRTSDRDAEIVLVMMLSGLRDWFRRILVKGFRRLQPLRACVGMDLIFDFSPVAKYFMDFCCMRV